MATEKVYVDCMDKSLVIPVSTERDKCVGDVILQVRNVRALYHIDCLAVKALSGDNQLQYTTKINEVLESGCGTEENPLKLMFANMKKRKRKESESLDILQDVIGAPSSFAKGSNWYEKQLELFRSANEVKCHRPAEFCGSHVSLYYKGFDTFTVECQSVSLDATDTKFVMQFCTKIAKTYDEEEDRMDVVRNCLSEYFASQEGITVEEIRRMDGAITVRGIPILIIEGKNEIGVGGCDSYLEVVAYYANELTKNATYFRAPCFLVEIVGPHIAISGAVKAKNVLVDRLTDLMWMLPLPNNRTAMARLARVFKALKNAVATLRLVYLGNESEAQPEFPYLSYIEGIGTIVYTTEIKRDVFLCKLRKGDKESSVIVKFVERYCVDAHRLMADNGYAPSIIAFKQVTSQFYVVVMEFIPNSMTLHDYIKSEQNKEHTIDQLKEHCSKALHIMHVGGYCHGDLRGNNILVKCMETPQPIAIIDFDWSGKNGVAKYPLFMNHINVTWPEGASDGELLRPDHDKYWIEKTFS